MPKKRSIFFEEWRDCLREHYHHVLMTYDTVTEPSLHTVLLDSGFSEADIQALRQQALDEGAKPMPHWEAVAADDIPQPIVAKPAPEPDPILEQEAEPVPPQFDDFDDDYPEDEDEGFVQTSLF